MKYKITKVPINQVEVKIDLKGRHSSEALGLLHAFYFGARGEHAEWGLSDKTSQVVMLLTEIEEARLQEFLKDVIEKL